jgi:hypothetical protein
MAPRSKDQIQVSDSTESVLTQLAAETFSKLAVVPKLKNDEGEDLPENERITPNQAYTLTVDRVSKFIDMIRDQRDHSKPTVRERKEQDAVIAEAIGQPLGKLGTTFVRVKIGDETSVVDGKNVKTPVYHRLSFPELRRVAESKVHPLNKFVERFLAENELRFTEQKKSEGAKGKNPVVLEYIGKPSNSDEPEHEAIAS